MATPGQKDQNKAGKNFDTGSTNALPNVDLASGIYEAPAAVQPEAQAREPVSVAGGPLDKQATGGSSAGAEQKATGVKSDGSSGQRNKDTAGAAAMIL